MDWGSSLASSTSATGGGSSLGATTPPGATDLDRLRLEYDARQQRLANSDIYSFFNLSYLFALQQRQRDTLKLLHRAGWSDFANKRVFEVGCGRGGVLIEYLAFGATSLSGIDLLADRVVEAKARLPQAVLSCADGQHLPFACGSFDLVLQYTAFSSVLNDTVKRNMAREMLRVLHPGGLILWYDFWLNPINPQTRGIRLAEIKQLFPDCVYTSRRVTLAPPIARRLVRVSWLACALLEKFRLFNTHYLVAIRKKTSPSEEAHR